MPQFEVQKVKRVHVRCDFDTVRLRRTCARAVAILSAVIPKDAGPDDFIFRGSNRSAAWNERDPSRAQAVRPSIITHGCRSSFPDWAGDETSFPREIAEMA